MRRERTEQAARRAAGAHRRAKVHHRLRKVAAARLGRDRVHLLADFGASAGQRGIQREKPRDDPLDIGIHHDRPPLEGNGRHSGGSIGAEPWQGAKTLFGIGKGPALRGHFASTGQQVAGAGVVTEACPGGHDFRVRRSRQRFHGRPAAGELGEIGFYRRDRGLLQHDFGQPDPVGIGRRRAGRRTPRQIAGVGIVPVEQGGR